MLSKKMIEMSSQKSVIREIFEYGMERAKVVGRENIFDFSIGNPNVPAPKKVDEIAINILSNEDPVLVHGYPSNAGMPSVRAAIANNINKVHGTNLSEKNVFMTIGAAGAIMTCFRALTDSREDEILAFAPYFPEYAAFVTCAGATFKVVPADMGSFQINFEKLEEMLNPNTKAIIVNSPNNPTGIIYSKETIEKLAKLLNEKQKEYGHSIYIISDEPYRDIVFEGFTLPFIPDYYENTLICYSYSKSLSLPGERIGYIAFTDQIEDQALMMDVLIAAARSLAYVGVPSLYQRVIEQAVDMTAELSIYENNKKLFYNALIDMGYECVEPGGAFYLFPKALEEDATAFCERAKKYDLLMVPSDSFGCPGYVRISYCVPTQTIERALPLFEKLAQEYK